MDAIVVEKPGIANLKRVPVPSPAPGEVLIETHAVALNPTDWKHRDFVAPPGAVLGCDFAGVVQKVTEGVTNVKVGDRVASFVHGGAYDDHGAFAEFIKADAELLWKIPEAVSWEEAAALGGVGPDTAFFALYVTLNLARPTEPLETPEDFLVWDGATSVGLYATQLAKMSGYRVITTASSHNFALVKSYGSDEVYSYADPETPAKISAAHPTLSRALDCIGEHRATASTARSLGTQGSNKRHIVKLTAPEEGDSAGLDIEVTPILAYMLLGKSFNKFGMDFPSVPAYRSALAEWCLAMPDLITKKGLKSNPLWKQEGRLEKVNDALELLKAGKVSGRKVVFLL